MTQEEQNKSVNFKLAFGEQQIYQQGKQVYQH